jgi:hypothetical protein
VFKLLRNVREAYRQWKALPPDEREQFASDIQRIRRLGVGPEEVVQLVEAGDRWLVAEGAVWSAAIVEVESAGEGGVAFGAVAIDGAVGPAAERGADEPFGFAVGLGSVGPGAEVADPERPAGDRVNS